MLVRKYARCTDRPVTLVGVVSQAGGERATRESQGAPHMKEVLAAMGTHVGAIEESFTERLDNEILIDPVAVYVELVAGDHDLE